MATLSFNLVKHKLVFPLVEYFLLPFAVLRIFWFHYYDGIQGGFPLGKWHFWIRVRYAGKLNCAYCKSEGRVQGVSVTKQHTAILESLVTFCVILLA